MEPEDVTGLCQ